MNDASTFRAVAYSAGSAGGSIIIPQEDSLDYLKS